MAAVGLNAINLISHPETVRASNRCYGFLLWTPSRHHLLSLWGSHFGENLEVTEVVLMQGQKY